MPGQFIFLLAQDVSESKTNPSFSMSLVSKGFKYSLQIECCPCFQGRHNEKERGFGVRYLYFKS